MADSEWSVLMAAAQRGDSTSYRRLLGELKPWLTRYHARRLPPAVVDDAVQETLIAIHEKRHTYDPARPFGPWLAAIARYKWIDRLRTLRRTAAEPLSGDVPIKDHGSEVISAAILEQLLAGLKPAQAEAIRLVKIHGFSVEEASAKTGQSVALVKVNIHRGLARMMLAVQTQAHADG